eukprot:2526669-Heterocapsa_arctica.AAC.1
MLAIPASIPASLSLFIGIQDFLAGQPGRPGPASGPVAEWLNGLLLSQFRSWVLSAPAALCLPP